jgi:septal ring factor EnvC (AmiA/AmiB activator)
MGEPRSERQQIKSDDWIAAIREGVLVALADLLDARAEITRLVAERDDARRVEADTEAHRQRLEKERANLIELRLADYRELKRLSARNAELEGQIGQLVGVDDL